MKVVIHKHIIAMSRPNYLALPGDSQILKVAGTKDPRALALWEAHAIKDSGEPSYGMQGQRTVYVVDTDEPFEYRGTYVDTVVAGGHVYHVFADMYNENRGVEPSA